MSQCGNKAQVVYYLSRAGKLEPPHMIEVPISSPDGLRLADVKQRLTALRGNAMPNMFSWSYKRLYKSTQIWQDVSDEDSLTPDQSGEYVLKGSEYLEKSQGPVVGAAGSGPVVGAPGYDTERLDLLRSFWLACRRRKPNEITGHIVVKEWHQLHNKYNMFVPCRKGLYVRRCFSDFLKVALKAYQEPRPKFVHVSGPPGIGKSAFMWYVVMMVGAVTGNPGLEADWDLDYDLVVQLVVGDLTKSWVCFYRNGSVSYSDSIPPLAGRKVLHLVDQKFMGHHFGNVMLFPSPDENNTKLIDKIGGVPQVTKILPPWSKDKDEFYELMQIELNLTIQAVEKIVQAWGYVPRVIFREESLGKDISRLQFVIDKVTLQHASLFLCEKFKVESSFLPCRLFEMDPETLKYEDYTVEFATDYLANAYFERYWDVKRDEVVAFVKATEFQPITASLRGYGYEYCMARFWSERQTRLVAVSIGDTPERARAVNAYPSQLILEVGKRKIRHYKHLADIEKAREDREDLTQYLWLPRMHNPLVDFLLFKPNIMGQATISETHSILEQKLLETAAFMWDMTSYEELTSYIIVTPGQHWKGLLWKNLKGQDRERHDSLLPFIGRYYAQYELPVGTRDKAAATETLKLQEFKLPEPEKVKAAAKKVLDSAKQRSDNAKQVMKNRKRRLDDAGTSAGLEILEREYSTYEAKQLGITETDADYEGTIATCGQCMRSSFISELGL